MPFERFEEELEVEERPFDGARFRRMLGYLVPYRRQLVWMVLAVVLASGVTLLDPYLFGRIVDDAILARNPAALNRLVVVLLVLHVLTWVGTLVRMRITNTVGQAVLYDLRQQLFDHIQRLSLRFYDQRPVGRIMSRITSDVNAISELINGGLVTILSQSVAIVGILGMMLWLSWRLSLLSFVVMPPLLWLFGKLGPYIERSWKNVRRMGSNMSANVNESVNGMLVTQAFRREPRNMETFGRLTQRSNDAWMRTIRMEEFIWPVVDVTGVLGTSLVLVVGAWLVLRGQVTLGLILAFSNYLWRFWAPISAMSKVYGQMLSAMASAERIFEFLDTAPEVEDAPNAQPMPPIRGEVHFDHVSFRYDPEQPLVLRDIRLVVPPGETVALVGQTGSGKSSIINLLMRFYDPAEGAVRVDGHDLRDVTLASLRRQMAIVLQDSFLFSGTLAENIRYGNPTATDADVQRVAEAVHLVPFIETLENGYDHEVGERGGRLSVGQRQLVAFARALLADPRILILDEATSSVDTETERIIQRAMATLLEGRTAFIIAHRLSTIRHADRILVIHEGEIAEQGTHEELLQQEGRYYELYVRQFVGAQVVEEQEVEQVEQVEQGMMVPA